MNLNGDSKPPTDERPTIQLTTVSWVGDPPDGPGMSAPTAASGSTGAVVTGDGFGGHAATAIGRPSGAHAGLAATGGPGARTGTAGGPTVPTGAGRRTGLRSRVALIASGTAAVVVAGLGVTGYAYSGEVPRGTRVLGVELGGLSRQEATDLLSGELGRRGAELAAPVRVRVGSREGEFTPGDVGLAVDVAATVAAAVENDARPRLFGTRDVAPVVTVDPDRLDHRLRTTAGPLIKKMTLPAITFKDLTPTAVHPEPGTDLDPARSADAVRAGWPADGPIEVPLVETRPVTTAEEVDRLLTELARPAVAAGVPVSTDRGGFTVAPRVIARSLVLTADQAGRIHPRVDAKKLRAALADQLTKVEITPKDARITIEGGKPRVLPGSDGQQVDLAALGRELLGVLPKTEGRQVTGVLAPAGSETTAEELSGLGIKERVSTFTTRFTGGASSSRTQNIVTIAKDVDGAVVKPGETFSLNGHTGERGKNQGYQDAPVILDGKLVPGVGGGTSQFTTTLFNATYYAGLEDVEHKPHSYWFDRYPPVIESTIFWPDLDFKFRNDSPYGVVIDTSTTASSVTVSIWSTKVYDKVKTEWGPRRNITQPEIIHLEPVPTCIPTNGINGFTQDAWRIFHKDGKVVKREKFSWTYSAEPRFVCDHKPA